MSERNPLYNKVSPVFDFASLYPSVMRKISIKNLLRKDKIRKIFRR
jgi:DNA polymerase elongation subunit (family B)